MLYTRFSPPEITIRPTDVIAVNRK